MGKETPNKTFLKQVAAFIPPTALLGYAFVLNNKYPGQLSQWAFILSALVYGLLSIQNANTGEGYQIGQEGQPENRVYNFKSHHFVFLLAGIAYTIYGCFLYMHLSGGGWNPAVFFVPAYILFFLSPFYSPFKVNEEAMSSTQTAASGDVASSTLVKDLKEAYNTTAKLRKQLAEAEDKILVFKSKKAYVELREELDRANETIEKLKSQSKKTEAPQLDNKKTQLKLVQELQQANEGLKAAHGKLESLLKAKETELLGKLEQANAAIKERETTNEGLRVQLQEKSNDILRLKSQKEQYEAATLKGKSELEEQLEKLKESMELAKSTQDYFKNQAEVQKSFAEEIKAAKDELLIKLDEQEKSAAAIETAKQKLAQQIEELKMYHESALKTEAGAAEIKYQALKTQKEELEKLLEKQNLQIKKKDDELNSFATALNKGEALIGETKKMIDAYKEALDYIKRAAFVYLKNKETVEITDFIRFSLIADDLAAGYSRVKESKNYAILMNGKTADSLKDQTTRLTYNEAVLNKDLTCLVKWTQQHKDLLPDGKWDLFFENKEIDPNIKF